MRNPTVTPGYWGMPEETAAAITPDGWLHTGDLVTCDGDGVYTFVARKKEVLRRRGENLSPAEVEEAIESHSAVVECAVVGVPSELSEEEIKAFVVLREDVAVRCSCASGPRSGCQRSRCRDTGNGWRRFLALPTQRVAKHRLPAEHPEDEFDADSPIAKGSP